MDESTQNLSHTRKRTNGGLFSGGVPKRTFLLLVVIGLFIIVPFCLFGDAITAWTSRLIEHADANRAYTGAILILLLAVDIVMPIPSSLVSTACGMTLGFAGGALASFAGMSISATTGYLIGCTASPAVKRMIGETEIAWLKAFQQRNGVWMLLALRPVPVLAEASILFSGLSRQPLPGVVIATLLGNMAVSLAYAAVGAWGKASDSFLPAFGASLLISGAFMLRMRRKQLSPAACSASK